MTLQSHTPAAADQQGASNLLIERPACVHDFPK